MCGKEKDNPNLFKELLKWQEKLKEKGWTIVGIINQEVQYNESPRNRK